jgi:hypothetical protein
MNNLKNDDQRRMVLKKKPQTLIELRQDICDVITPLEEEHKTSILSFTDGEQNKMKEVCGCHLWFIMPSKIENAKHGWIVFL